MIGDLTTLGRVKDFLSITTTNSDTVLARLISAVSATVLQFVDRPGFGLQQVSDVYDGNGKDYLLLRQWPVVEVASVECCGTTIPASPDTTRWPPAAGFVVEGAESAGDAQQRLQLFGYVFPRQRSGVRVIYTAGYRTLDEPQTVPGSGRLDTDQVWLSDLGVTLADGTPLTFTAGAPAAGEYSLDGSTYLFNEAQAGAAVLVSYSNVPANVSQAVNAMVGEAYKRKDRLGIVSQSVAGQETVSYSQRDMNAADRLSLNPFKRVTPA